MSVFTPQDLRHGVTVLKAFNKYGKSAMFTGILLPKSTSIFPAIASFLAQWRRGAVVSLVAVLRIPRPALNTSLPRLHRRRWLSSESVCSSKGWSARTPLRSGISSIRLRRLFPGPFAGIWVTGFSNPPAPRVGHCVRVDLNKIQPAHRFPITSLPAPPSLSILHPTL